MRGRRIKEGVPGEVRHPPGELERFCREVLLRLGVPRRTPRLLRDPW